MLSICPLGVSPFQILGELNKDLVDGVTTGFMDMDSNGIRPRIFLDVFGIVGNSPV